MRRNNCKIVLIIFVPILFCISCIQTDSGNHYCDAMEFADGYSASKYSVSNSFEEIVLNMDWQFADFSKIHSGTATLYKTELPIKKHIMVAVNAGHGTKGGNAVKTYSHPDKTPKITGGTNPLGAVESLAVSNGMTFCNNKQESEINLRVAVILRKLLLEAGFDVLMIRNSDDVQLDNIARTVISNNCADIHIAIHFDSDGYQKDKGCFYCSIPESLKNLPNVNNHFKESTRLGECLINGLKKQSITIYNNGKQDIDLTQTSYSTIPSIDIELGNQCTATNTETLEQRAAGIMSGIQEYFYEY